MCLETPERRGVSKKGRLLETVTVQTVSKTVVSPTANRLTDFLQSMEVCKTAHLNQVRESGVTNKDYLDVFEDDSSQFHQHGSPRTVRFNDS